ncbi:MAG: HD domain-containing protein [Nitrospirae bacterium]|nr:HD domain-containing protein [Nitrospirota bacterium]
MTQDDLIYFKSWFADYTRSYYSPDNEDQKNILLKVEHTDNVCRNIVKIAEGSSLDGNQVRLAEAVALFHDVGRFRQYTKYKTFRDSISLNHGLLGSRILVEEKVLQRLPVDEQQLIIQAVKFHNAFAIPTVLDSEVVLFLKLIRDADKVDIFRVFIEYYESPVEKRASATAFRMPDVPEYSKVMISCIINKHVASYSNIRSVNDFKLMKLSWVYDMHFKESVRLLQERNYVNSIINKLPQTEDILAAAQVLREYISQRLNSDEEK